MALNAQQNDAIHFQLGQLLEFGEPAAFLATLQRIAEHMAFKAARAADRDEAEQWNALSLACAHVGHELERARLEQSQIVFSEPV